jgi:hypothetical protein
MADGMEAQVQPTRHQTRRGLILRDLGDQGISFYSLAVMKSVHRELAATVRLGHS